MLRTFRFWCQKVLPLVYEDSLSYYELLCKVVKYINELIESDREIIEDVDALKDDMAVVQQWIKNDARNTIEKYVREFLATAIYVGLNDNGHIVYYIPDSWTNIDFKTTGYDVDLSDYDYGHLVLYY